MGKLDVGSANHLNGFHNGVGVVLQPFLKVRCNGQHGGGTIAVSGMDPHGIHVFNETDRDFLVLRIAYNFQFKLFPAQDGFFHQNLVDPAGRYAAGRDRAQLFNIVDQAAAAAAHGISGADDHRVAEALGDRLRLRNRVDDFALGHLDAEPVHGLFEFQTVFTALDGIHVYPDNLDAVFGEDASLVQIRGQIQAGLPPQVRQQGVRTLFGDNLGQDFDIQWFYIGCIRCTRIGHDGGRVRVDQNNFIPQ